MRHILTLLLLLTGALFALGQGRIDVGANTSADRGRIVLSGGRLSAGGPSAGDEVNINNDGEMDLTNGDVEVYGNIDNDGDMDLTNGDVEVYGNIDNDGDMDLTNGDVEVYRAGTTANVTNGTTNPSAVITFNGANLFVGAPSVGSPAAGSSGSFTNAAGGGSDGVSGTTGVVSTTTSPNRDTLVVNGNIDNDGDMDLTNGDVEVYGNIDNDGDMDLTNGDVEVYGNIDNDGDMDLTNGDVEVYRAGTTANVTNGATNSSAVLTLNGTNLFVGAPSIGSPSTGSSGSLINAAGGGSDGASGTAGVVSDNTFPTMNTVTVNGNIDNDGDMDLTNGDVEVYGNIDNDGDMDLTNGDVEVYGNIDNDGDMDLTNGDVEVYRAGTTANVNNGVTNPAAVITLNGTNLFIGAPSTGSPATGSSGIFNNDAGGGDDGVAGTTGVVSDNAFPTMNNVTVNGNIDNDGDMDLTNGDVEVYGNIDNDGDMDLTNGDVEVYRAGAGTGNVTNGATGTIILAPANNQQTTVQIGGDLANSGNVTTSPAGSEGSIIIFNGDNTTDGPQSFTPGTSTFENIQVGTTTPSVQSVVNLGGDLTVSNNVNVDNGELNTSPNEVVLQGNATLTGEDNTNSLSGTVSNQQTVGTNASESFGGDLGITILNPNGINLGTVTVRRFTGLGVGESYIDPTILTDRRSIDATYEIESSAFPTGTIGTGPTDSVQIQFVWQASQDNNVDLGYPGFNAVYYSTNATLPAPASPDPNAWQAIDGLTVVNHNTGSGLLDMDPRRLTVTTNHFSFWTPGGFILGVLAVEWAEVSAYTIPNPAPALNNISQAVQIDWATASESSSDHFEVEHSIDGQQFTTIGSVAAAQHSLVVTPYSFVHQQPVNGLNHYRIKAYDQDGGSSNSTVMTVAVAEKETFTISYPNPMKAGNEFTLSLRETAETAGALFTPDGRQVATVLSGILAGNQTYRATLPEGLTQGVYILKLSINGENQAHRIVIE